MDSAPKNGSSFDVWAKCWLSSTDTFIHRRMIDCRYDRPFDSSFDSAKTELRGIEKGWVATHWMPLPAAPGPRQETSLQRIWVKLNRYWFKSAGEYTVTSDMRTLSSPSDPKNWMEFVEVRQPA